LRIYLDINTGFAQVIAASGDMKNAARECRSSSTSTDAINVSVIFVISGMPGLAALELFIRK
jgi:hypothetical protein